MPNRREFLFQMAAGAMGLSYVRFLSGCESIDIESKVSGGAFDFITPKDDWYWQSGNGNEQGDEEGLGVNRDNWELRITGPDGRIGTIDFDDLKAMEEEGRSMTYIKTMRCVIGSQVGVITDTRVSTGIFTGIPLPEIFSEFDVPSDSTEKVRTYGEDDFTSNLTVERATDPGPDPLPAMLSYEMNGNPLPTLRGGPVRLVIPEMWGYKNMKWVNRLNFTPDDSPFGGYETGLFAGSDAQGIIDEPGKIALTNFLTNPASQFDVELEGPDITIQGASVAGGSRMDDVEVSLDGGEFESADFLQPDQVLASDAITPEMRNAIEEAENFGGEWPPKDVWVIWSKPFEDLETGEHSITIRSSDADGRVTPESVGNVEHYEIEPRISIDFTVT